MKFCFVAPIFFLDIDSKINNGLKLDHMNISNTDFFLKKSVLKEPFLSVLGDYSIYDFYDTRYGDAPLITPHFYFEGTLKGISKVNELKDMMSYDLGFGTSFVILFLMESQKYLESLWYLRDNAVYVRDGFVKFYDDGITDEQRIFKHSLKEIYYDSQSKRENVTYKKHELEQMYKDSDNKSDFFKRMKSISIEEFDNIHKEYWQHLNLFSKKSDLNRIEKATVFKNFAREQLASDMKIFFYISALEAFFNTSKNEITYQVSQRCALVLCQYLGQVKLRVFSASN